MCGIIELVAGKTFYNGTVFVLLFWMFFLIFKTGYLRRTSQTPPKAEQGKDNKEPVDFSPVKEVDMDGTDLDLYLDDDYVFHGIHVHFPDGESAIFRTNMNEYPSKNRYSNWSGNIKRFNNFHSS
jgi:hypothetical protein